MKKACFRCHVAKDVSDFHRDKSSWDGLSASCAACRNAVRRLGDRRRAGIPQEEVYRGDLINEGLDKLYGGQSREGDDLLSRLQKKFEATFTITVRKDGKSTIQVHSVPTIAYKAMNPSALLEKVLC